jgi:uncharacterized protein (DUF4415 family)
MNMVRYAQNDLPPITEARKAELKALAARPDSEIDYSDIPPLTNDVLSRVANHPLYRPHKTHATVRIDTDIILWLKRQGKGYQTRMNAILRDAMIKNMQQEG